MAKDKKHIIGNMKEFNSKYKLFDGSPMPNWNYNPKATIDSGIEIPYFDFNGNGKLDKANEKMWINALLKQVESGFNNLSKEQLSRIKNIKIKNKYLEYPEEFIYNQGSNSNNINVVDIVRILNSGE